jgi:Protein of unknown function (DUF4238)
MPESHRHHYISQFYLKNFVRDRANPALFVVDLRTQKSFTTSPSNVALENDFHRITTPGLPPDAVERRLSQFEADVAPALTRIISSASLSNAGDRNLILFFAILLLVKGPTMRGTLNTFTNTLMQRIGLDRANNPEAFAKRIEQLIAEGEMPPDTNAEELRQQVLRGNYTVGLSTEAHLKLEFEVAESLLPMVAERKWNVYKAGSGEFVTCDRPAILMWADPTKTEPVGLGMRHTRLLFPLSSSIAISGGFELDNATITVDASEVAKINGRIVVNANRQVYARDDDFEYALRHNEGTKKGSDLAHDELARQKAGNESGTGS